MHKLTVTFIFCLFAAATFAQQKPTPIHFEADAPAWAQMLLEEHPNVREIQAAYTAYYDEHAFVKNSYTQFYKRWMQWARPFAQADGTIADSGLRNADSERSTAPNRKSSIVNRQSTWSFNGPKVHFFPDASAQSVDHTNIYSFDIYAADPNILYAGGEAGGMWKTTDKGLNWTLLTADVLHGAFGAVKINPQNSEVVYAGTHGKLIKTTDSGATWATVYTETSFWANEIYVHEGNPDIVLCASEKGLLRSVDAGATWVKLWNTNTWGVKPKPNDPNTAWAIRDNGASSDFMISTDGGGSFTASNNGWWQPTGNRQVTGAIIAPCPSNPTKIYAFLSGEGDGLGGYIGVYKSTDGGATWANTHPNNSIGMPYSIPNHTNLMDANGVDWFHQGFYDQAIVVNPLNDNQIITGGCSWFRSNDGGATWGGYGGYVGGTGITGDRHPDIQWAAAVGNELWIASDGGLVYSTNFGQSVEGRNNGISGAALWGFDSGWNEDILVGGRYHNGNMAYHESFPAGSYYAIGGAEAATGYVNPGPERKIYHSDIGGDIIKPGFGNGLGGFPVGTWPNESYAYYANSEMEWHPNCWNIVYLGKEDKLWKSTDGGTTFTVLYDFPGGDTRKVYEIEIYRNDPNRMYVSQFNGTDDVVFRSYDAGETWQICAALPLPNNNDRIKMAVSAENPDVLWISLSYGSNGKKVYKTTDAGISWQNMTTSALDNATVTCILAQYGTDGGVYVGTTKGIFYRNNSMSDWQAYTDGLPISLEPNKMKPFYKKSLIRMAAWNGGVWEAPLFEPSATEPLAMVDKLTSFCPTDTFYFDDHSVVMHDNVSWSWQFADAQAVIGENTRTPRVVFNSAGDKLAVMTMTTPQGVFTDSLTVHVGDECTSLLPEALPGNALSLDGSGDYATLSQPFNLNSNTATITAWIKPIGDQSDWAGVALVRGGSTTAGLHFGENNQLRYMWNDQNWWWNTGVFPPLGEWSHVALVIEPSKATIYLNGMPTSLNTTHGIEEFDSPLVLGTDPNYNNRYFKGDMDEVCFYDKALTQNQIREEMHLTRTHTDTDGLRSYLQFNEADGPAFDRVGLGFASFGGDAHRIVSTVAVGPGVSSRKFVTASGLLVFGETGVTTTFPVNGSVPEGEVVVTRIDIAPDQSPAADSISRSYWVLHNFDENFYFDELDAIQFDKIGEVPVGNVAQQYQLYARPPRGEGDTWQPLDLGDGLTPGTDGSVVFSDGNGVGEPAQFIIARPMGTAAQQPATLQSMVNVSPNPVASNGVLNISTNLVGKVKFKLFDEKGRGVRVTVFERNGTLSLNGLAAGIYAYSIENETIMKFGKVVVQ
ncbi:MAG: T9SS type A sorting domain-containing protein [Saprospiraceae bacterium]|nr:T9SS type A sorting domain-containing protein [Saprospiraceae bacterium]MCF8250363.1 T9SS type A sorting domain-containing protein [Saprospiraceae bacterium]MCF8280400.1 T9SS type A sorting domain-containing protein [Bacteroidales bacterium]MCF8312171.1 T9SS type A sorting domain-containing protein [Saprospiraceae bacterium]MCF8441865.1 T9SS type A sorting domain-containing protein [Saprospiraceae bacterium]